MIIGHLPAGYLFARTILAYRPIAPAHQRMFFVACLLGAVFPDFDLFFFYFVDKQQIHHHRYWVHLPLFWGILLAAATLWRMTAPRRLFPQVAVVFVLSCLLHLLLDTIVGDIWWLAPLHDQPFSLFTVSPGYQPWVLNFVFHWTFCIELGLLLLAFVVWCCWSATSDQKLSR